MDAQPLMIVSPEDLAEVLTWLIITTVWVAAGFGCGGYGVGQGIHYFVRWLRLRGASKPFAVRADELEQLRRRMSVRLERISARNLRERERASS